MPGASLEVALLSLEFVSTEIHISEADQITAIKDHYINALVQAEDHLLSIMKQEVLKTTYGLSPGKPEWRNELSNCLKEVYREVADNYVDIGVGVPSTDSLHNVVKYMLIAYGSGSKADDGGNPITAGPTGRLVWDDDLESQKPSESKTTYQLPDEFNQSGNHFISNSITLMEKHFNDVLANASRALENEVFYNNVVVTKGA